MVRMPQTVHEVVKSLSTDLPLRDRAALAHMKEEELDCVNFALSEFMRNCYGFGSENSKLVESCRSLSEMGNLDEYEASAVIVKSLWKELVKTHTLRILQ